MNAQAPPPTPPTSSDDAPVDLVERVRAFDADLYLLERGLRDMARKEDLSERGCARLRAWAGQRGLAMRVAVCGGPAPEQRGLGGGATVYSAFVGRSEAALDAAVHFTLVEERPGHPERDRARRETGRLLGYPTCCVSAFVALPRNTDAACLERLLGLASAGPMHLLSNWLVPSALVRHVPCAWDCPASRAAATAALESLAGTDSRLHHAIRWLLSRPLLVYDRFRAVVLDGEPMADGTVAVRRHFTFLDLCTDEAAHRSAALRRFARQAASLPRSIPPTGLPGARLLRFDG